MKRSFLALCLLFAALPLLAHEQRTMIPVLVDAEANRAYIPEGTVLPVQMNFRFEKFRLNETEIAQLRADRDGGKGNVRTVRGDRAATARLKAKPPLILQFAPAERFVQMRRNYEAQAAKRRPVVRTDSGHLQCFDFYVEDSAQGQYHEYSTGFTSVFCKQPTTYPGYVNYWEFHAIGGYSDDDQYIDPYAFVDDDNNNFGCFDLYSWPGDGACTATNSTLLLQQGCLNDVDTGSLQYIIEYLPGYVENYLGFNFLVDYCTYFY